MRVLENKVLRKVFGRYTKEVKEDWRKLHNEDFMLHTTCQALLEWDGWGMWSAHEDKDNVQIFRGNTSG